MNPRTRRQRRLYRKWHRPGRVLVLLDSRAGFSFSQRDRWIWKNYGRTHVERWRWYAVKP